MLPEDRHRGEYPTAAHSAHELEMQRLREERDALRRLHLGPEIEQHGTLSPQALHTKRTWFKVQRRRATQQRRRRGKEAL